MKNKTTLSKTQLMNKKYTFTSWSVQKDISPIIIDKAQGVYLWDEHGKRYLDFSSQLVLTNIGHSDPRVLKAMNEQMQKFQYVFPGHGSELRGIVGKKLAAITPGDLNKTFFTLGGADANENAMKIARQVAGREKIITRYRSYHGGTFAAASAGGDPRRQLNRFELPWIIRIHDPYELRSPLYRGKTREQGEMLLLALMEETIKLEGPSTIAAIMVEGYSGSSGIMQATSKKYWQGLRALCDKYGILIIDDEVMSGFGRTGKYFGIEHAGITPDIITMAKGLTSGYAPLGAVSVNRKIAKYFEENNFNCGLTYSSHAISLAAANAVLDIYQKDDLINRAEKMGKYLKSELMKLKKNHKSLGDVRGIGMHYVLELVSDKELTPLSNWNEPLTRAMEQTVAMLKRERLQVLSRWNFIFVNPPLIISKEQIDEGIQKLDMALKIADKYFK